MTVVVDMKLSFGDLFTDGGHTILDYFNMTVYDTEFMLDVMSKSNINIQKVRLAPPTLPSQLLLFVNVVIYYR